ncbi:MAG TPA: uroporphyrinogen decarboxylase [Isosphaeraceae bacterium]|jgi:uroporphyrinogen decarboxylase|nr:uroporphyrinogen decarboxylase [Isosphaeraceae bacterium]
MSTDAAPAFAGLRVAAFESRLARPMADLIARHGGVPVEAPALREIPFGENPEALEFADRLLECEFDAVVFQTGVGTRFLAQTIETQLPRSTWVESLNRTKVIARGPKPAAALRELNARIDFVVHEPNTWHETLQVFDANLTLAGQRVAVQEYGKPSTELIAGLQERGAIVTRVPVYRWALPDDTRPLRRTIAEIAEGRVGVVLFTSAQQVEHLLQVAEVEGREADLRAALRRHVVVGSVGPSTSETLRARGLPVDIEPIHPKMGHLVAAAAAGWRGVGKVRPNDPSFLPVEVVAAPPAASAAPVAYSDPLRDSLFMKACRREPTDVTPIWLMRQAGRYMADYRALRQRVSFLELCKRPELATEVTVTAAKKLGVDAAILFADILLILEPMGLVLEFARGEGPVIHNPVRAISDVDRIRPMPVAAPLEFVCRTVRAVRAALEPGLPLIGFAGAPFTLACYAIEGGASRHYDLAKSFMYHDKGAWNVLMEKLVEATAAYLNAQADAGVQALQLFDSWVGTLGPDDYRTYVLPHMRSLFARLRPGIPTIHFGTDTGSLLELQREAGGQVIGLDWRVDLGKARERLGPDVAVQGNLDPAVLLAPIPTIQEHARRILDRADGQPGHIFNLGHGILPATPVDHVLALIDTVHLGRKSS